MRAFRVEPPDHQVDESIGTGTACFINFHDLYVFVLGWYGETCNVYEVDGLLIVHEEHTAQIGFGPADHPLIIKLPVVILKETSRRLIGVVKVEDVIWFEFKERR